jgi:hypothetical protein
VSDSRSIRRTRRRACLRHRAGIGRSSIRWPRAPRPHRTRPRSRWQRPGEIPRSSSGSRQSAGNAAPTPRRIRRQQRFWFLRERQRDRSEPLPLAAAIRARLDRRAKAAERCGHPVRVPPWSRPANLRPVPGNEYRGPLRTPAPWADLGCLCNDKTRRSTLRVVLYGKRTWHVSQCRAVARERCHDDAVRQPQHAQPIRLEQPLPCAISAIGIALDFHDQGQ